MIAVIRFLNYKTTTLSKIVQNNFVTFTAFLAVVYLPRIIIEVIITLLLLLLSICILLAVSITFILLFRFYLRIYYAYRILWRNIEHVPW